MIYARLNIFNVNYIFVQALIASRAVLRDRNRDQVANKKSRDMTFPWPRVG